MKKTDSIITHSGRNPSANFGVVNPPVYHASTIVFDKFSEFKKTWDGSFKGITYGRHGSESHKALETLLCDMEGADKCLITPSGMSAISCALLSFLNEGDHLLMVDSVYSPTRIFCDQELKRLGIEVTYYDPTIGSGISKLIQKNTKVIYTESPGSLTFEIQDIPAIAAAAKKAGAVTIIDNTWATPLYFKAFEHGIDVIVHSATKYICGHSDVMMGIINCKKAHYAQIKRTYKNLGIYSGPDDIYLASRGARTLAVRIRHQQKVALELAKMLEKHSKVEAVLHPALSSHPQHKLWKRDFEGASGLFGFVLKKKLDDKGYSKFLDGMDFFKMGYSWGGYESLIIPFKLQGIRTATKQASDGAKFRVSAGLEDVDDLLADLESALSRV